MPIPDRQENLCVKDGPVLTHVTHGLPNAGESAVATFTSTRVDSLQPRVDIGISREKCSTGAFGVSLCMEVIDKEQCVRKKIWFPCQAIGTERTCKIVDDSFRWFLPSGEQCGENVIAALTAGDAVKPVAYTVRAPDTHNATC